MLRERQVDEPLEPLTVEELSRKVGWQVSTAYGLAAPAPEPAVPAPPLPALEPATPPPLPTLADLERLVADAAADHPEHVEEWRWYLFYLRDFAGADGTLDDTFRLLVETAFAPLL